MRIYGCLCAPVVCILLAMLFVRINAGAVLCRGTLELRNSAICFRWFRNSWGQKRPGLPTRVRFSLKSATRRIGVVRNPSSAGLGMVPSNGQTGSHGNERLCGCFFVTKR
jgi:hypothetical protein